jgi:predicted DNA-binding protein YlxM (UPF0122 family)
MPNQDQGNIIKQIALLKNQGYSVREIAEELGKAKSTVQDMINRYNLNTDAPANNYQQQQQHYQSPVFSGIEGVSSQTNFIIGQLQQQIQDLRIEKRQLEIELGQKNTESFTSQVQIINLQNQVDNKQKDLDRLQEKFQDYMKQANEEPKEDNSLLNGIAGTFLGKVAEKPEMLFNYLSSKNQPAALAGTPGPQASAKAKATPDEPKYDMIDHIEEWLSNQDEKVVTQIYGILSAIMQKNELLGKILNVVQNEFQEKN